jgi:hypothetical protein
MSFFLICKNLLTLIGNTHFLNGFCITEKMISGGFKKMCQNLCKINEKSRDSERPGYAVYERIAQIGLIYDMKKKSVEDILIAISPRFKSN